MSRIGFFALIFFLTSCGGGGSDNGSLAPSPPPPPVGQTDTTPPLITLNGPSNVYVLLGDAYEDQGATYTDDSGAVPTSSVEGVVDTSKIGTYVITYSAADAAGNTAQRTRLVDVLSRSLFDFYTQLYTEKKVLRSMFKSHYLTGMETSIYAQDALLEGDYDKARQLVEAAFESTPLYDNIWREGASDFGLNNGDPIGYYSLRMIDQITRAMPIETNGEFVITAVMARCTYATRPINANYDTERVYLELDVRMMMDDARVLREAIKLTELWIKAITGGLEARTVVHIQEACTETAFSVFDTGGYGGTTILTSYPDADDMIDRVPVEIAEQTNMWVVISPSGVVGDGTGYPYWVDGGSTFSQKGRILLLATDKHFLRKYYQNGSGDYSDVERRVYQPQWFQHEIMHGLYRLWPEYELEINGHDWFVRSFWPDDFVGIHEPDFYYESIEKRLKLASPTLNDKLREKEWREGDINDVGFDAIAGEWRLPAATNNFHYVDIVFDGLWYWTNAAGRKWILFETNGQLFADTGFDYGVREIKIKLDESGAVDALFFLGEEYRRVGSAMFTGMSKHAMHKPGFCPAAHPLQRAAIQELQSFN